MPQKSFSAQVDAWVLQTKQRQEAVFKESSQRVIEEMQKPVAAGGNMPVDTGFLRASMLTTLGAPATQIKFNPGSGVFNYTGTETVLTIARAEVGDAIYAVYTANYASYVEYGTRGRAGRGFVRLAAQRWKSIVAEVVNEAKARAAANG